MLRRQRGFSYLIAMFLVAALSVVSVRALENSLTSEHRERETELLRIGQLYQSAIQNYYENSPGMAKAYPADLASLLLDARSTRLRRPLRKLYRDPITGSTQWGVVYADGGGVMGVFSLSTRQPFKADGFPANLANFVGAKRYRDWCFVYRPH